MASSGPRELIGSPVHIARYAPRRPDSPIAVNKHSQFPANPRRVHLDAALQVLVYVKGTKYRSLHFGGFRSTSAYVFRLGLGAVSWESKKPTSVALSSVESEYMAMCQAAQAAVWLSSLLEDLGVELRTSHIIYGANLCALALALNPDSHLRSKHADIQYHFTRGLVDAGRITVEDLLAKLTIAGALTKPPPASIRRTDISDASPLGACVMVLQTRGVLEYRLHDPCLAHALTDFRSPLLEPKAVHRGRTHFYP